MTSKLLKAVLATLRIQHNLAAIQHHQTNGKAERTIRTLNDILAIFIDLTQTNWASILPFATLAHNCSLSKSTGFSPFKTVYGREPRMPSTLELPREIRSRLQNFHLATLRDKVREHILHDQHQQAIEYNKHRRIVTFNVEDLVMLYQPSRKIGLNPKLQSHFHGPFKIVEVVDELNYHITPLFGCGAGTKLNRIHVANLKPFIPVEANNTTIESLEHTPNTILPAESSTTTIKKSGAPLEDSSETMEESAAAPQCPTQHKYNLRSRKQYQDHNF
jgi:hypothetical protein